MERKFQLIIEALCCLCHAGIFVFYTRIAGSNNFFYKMLSLNPVKHLGKIQVVYKENRVDEAKNYEIFASTFGGHRFMTYFTSPCGTRLLYPYKNATCTGKGMAGQKVRLLALFPGYYSQLKDLYTNLILISLRAQNHQDKSTLSKEWTRSKYITATPVPVR